MKNGFARTGTKYNGASLHLLILVALCVSLFPVRPPTVAAFSPAPVTAVAAAPTVTAQIAPQAKPDYEVVASQSQRYSESEPETSTKTSLKDTRKLLVANSDDVTIAALKSSATSATKLADYGSFSLWQASLPEANFTALLTNRVNGYSVEDVSSYDTIGLRGGAQIDTRTNQEPQSATPLRQSKTAEAQLWLVQFIGPLKGAWLDDLKTLGIEPVIYMPHNAYLVWATGVQLDRLTELQKQPITAKGTNYLQWSGPYHPAYRLDPALQVNSFGDISASQPARNANDPLTVTVQLYNTPNLNDSLTRLQKLAVGGASKAGLSSETINQFTNVTLELPFGELVNVAKWADVYNIERYVAPTKKDEAQGQIIAGNLTTSGGNVVPSAPGYLNWLQSKGFSDNPLDYPIVDVVDDGLDNGTNNPLHPDFHRLGNRMGPTSSRVVANDNCTSSATGNSLGGHGNINAGIVGSYNAQVGNPYVDAQGYNRGLGVSPYGRIASSKVFNDMIGFFDTTNCGGLGNYSGLAAQSWNKGALISSNSWGGATNGTYPATSQTYDALVRDASAASPGNQELMHVFAAGNSGPGLNTINSPASAKNVLTVGATENVRDEGIVDGCGMEFSDNADDIADFSGRGPTTDGRVKPDIQAPGVHIQGPASQDPGFTGKTVCGGSPRSQDSADPNRYYPNPTQNGINQTLYTWSSGTSHSTPAVAGGLSLIYNYYKRVLRPGQWPSPAMGKALVTNTPRYLTGQDAGGNLPSNTQGWGNLNLGTVFDGTPRFVLDQYTTFGETGQVMVLTGTVGSGAKPFHVTLAWSDAPGSTTGNAWVNNLDLEVQIGGQTYKGNVFSGATSVVGPGVADIRNNIENVFLGVGATGAFTVTVRATNIAGNGVPNNADATDQDFALVVYNATGITVPVKLSQTDYSLSGGDGDGIVEQGENLGLQIGLFNTSPQVANNAVGTLTTLTPGVTVTTGTSSYGNIGDSIVVTNSSFPYQFQVGSNVSYNSVITFVHTVTYNGGTTNVFTFTVPMATLNVSQSSTALVVLSSTDGDTVPEPGETVGLAIGVSTSGNTVAPGAVGTLATTTPGIAFLSASASYGTLAPGTTITNTSAPYVIRISPSFACGGLITFTHTINYQTGSQVATHTLRLNALAPLTQFSSPDVPKPIPATGTPIVNSFLTINQPGTIGRLTVNLNINHSFTGDMIMTLTNQTTGTNIRLYNRHGGGGQNLVGTTLDDYAPVSLIGSRAPFTGFFRPVQPLSAFNGQPISGTWKLTIADVLEDDGGTLNAWGLGFATEPFICEPVVVPSAAKIEAVVGTPQSTSVSTTFPTNLQAVVTGTDNFPLAGVVVTFTAPALPGSPGGTFTGGSTTNLTSSITVTTDANGRAIAPAFGANGIIGTYTVTAQVSGVVTPANFVLTNLANCNPLIVTLATDDGSGNVCGTLSHALVNSSAGMTITLFTAGTGITVTGQLPPLAVGVNLDGGECGQTQTRFSIVGTQSGIGSGSVDGLRLSGNNLLRNLAIRGFSGRQIVALALIGGNGSGNQIRCTAAYK